ncbi:glycosyltransferase [Sorangium sp. So ce295]|uniref:glycosyltransferase n=1 Tax=Sorangium sp. So ce295 TaxID=3133295 RepID=UPI003F5EED98
MPTFNRRAFVPQAIACFLAQDYEPRELIILDDGSDPVADLVPSDARIRYRRLSRRLNVGQKRNLACAEARGEIIVHWDDDDWSAPFRISYQLAELIGDQADLCGAARILYWDEEHDRAWWYSNASTPRLLAGNTLCYTRAHWSRRRFAPVQVGEDVRFVRASADAKQVVLTRADFLVARIHRDNVSPKRTVSPTWQRAEVEEVRRIVGVQESAPEAVRSDSTASVPLVSCIMPTFQRRPFVPLAITYFQRQTYPNLELIVVDDGPSVRDLMPADPRVRYLRLPTRWSIGAKRNLAVQKARGQIIVHWDDDDWHAPTRVATQVAPILTGQADATYLDMQLVLSLRDAQLARCTPALHTQLHGHGGCPGTLAFRRALWGKARYPAVQVAEDVSFIRQLARTGARIERLRDERQFIVVRHAANTWDAGRDWGDALVEAAPEDLAALSPDWSHYERLHAALALPRPLDRRTPPASRASAPFPDTALVVSLARSSARRAHMQAQLAALGDGLRGELLEAVDGRTLDLAAFREAAWLREASWLRRELRPGEVGCWLSHLEALQTLVARDLDCGLVLEDDVCLVPDFPRALSERLAALRQAGSGYQALMLDCYEGRGSWAPRAPRSLLPGGFFQLGVSARGCPGARAYLVTRDGARRLLQRLCSGPIDQPFDEVLREQSERGLRVLCAHPSLIHGSGHDSLIIEAAAPSTAARFEPAQYLATVERHARSPWWKSPPREGAPLRRATPSVAPDEPARVLLLVWERDWVGTLRLPRALAGAGASPCALAPEGSALLAASELAAQRSYAARPEACRSALLAACHALRPELILPCDDRSAHLLAQLLTDALAGKRRLDPRLRSLLRRSLGTGPYLERVTRAGFARIARRAGVRLPDQRDVRARAEAEVAAALLGGPVVLKRDDGSSAGAGVRVVSGPDGLQRAWCELFTSDQGNAVLQRHVAGMPAMATFAAFEGHLLGVLTAEKTETHGPLGPSRVTTFVEDGRMVEMTRRFAREAGFTGIGSIDFIRGPEHGPVAIEFNARPTPLASRGAEVGMDLFEALMVRLRGGRVPGATGRRSA